MANLFRCGSNQNSNLGGKLLWTNPSPTSDFSAQKINVDLSKYNKVIIVFKADKTKSNTDKSYMSNLLLDVNQPLSQHQVGVGTAPSGVAYGRCVEEVSSSGITFDNGGWGSGNIANAMYIPLYIYGINLTL